MIGNHLCGSASLASLFEEQQIKVVVSVVYLIRSGKSAVQLSFFAILNDVYVGPIHAHLRDEQSQLGVNHVDDGVFQHVIILVEHEFFQHQTEIGVAEQLASGAVQQQFRVLHRGFFVLRAFSDVRAIRIEHVWEFQ